MYISESEKNELAVAAELVTRIEKLYTRMDVILEPLVKRAISSNDLNHMSELVYLLPSGFHRAELRAYINSFKN